VIGLIKQKYQKGISIADWVQSLPSHSLPKRRFNTSGGYRNHVINGALSELPIHEITKSALVGESPLLIPNLKGIVSAYGLNPAD